MQVVVQPYKIGGRPTQPWHFHALHSAARNSIDPRAGISPALVVLAAPDQLIRTRRFPDSRRDAYCLTPSASGRAHG